MSLWRRAPPTSAAFAPRGVELLVLQPTPFCNLDCDYCYLTARSSRARMSEAVLASAFQAVFGSHLVRGPVTIVWHAGEPLVLPVDYYRRALTLAAQANTRRLQFAHSFQTNGTLIDEEWCEFFLESQARVGVSVDGPASLHDAHRKTRSGGGTHGRVMGGIAELQRAGVDFHVISVITGESVEAPDELFHFYRDHGIKRVGFNIEEIEGEHTASSLDIGEASWKVRTFFARFLELMAAYPGEIELREAAGFGAFLAHGRAADAGNQENTPLSIVSVDWQGRVSTFSPELLDAQSAEYGDFRFGTVHDGLDALVAHPMFTRVQAEIASGIDECRRTCEYFGSCGGGSPANKFFETGSLRVAETFHCRLAKKAVVDAMLASVEGALGLSRS